MAFTAILFMGRLGFTLAVLLAVASRIFSDACDAAPVGMHTRTRFLPPKVRPFDVSSVYKV